jgi:DNA polymerase-4
LFGSTPAIAAEIRDRIRSELGLTCSVGVAASKFLAKLASEAAKPSASLKGVTPGKGVVVIGPGEELRFLHPLAIEALWGVGPATAERLRRLGVTTVGDLADLPASTIEGAVGKAAGSHLLRLANGIDDRRVEPDREVKSISHEETYPVDRVDAEGLRTEIVRMADAVAARMRKADVIGRTVTLKVRYGDFRTVTRSRTLPKGLRDGPALASIAGEILDGLELGDGIRLLGVGVSNLAPSDSDPVQMQLFDGAADGERGTVDEGRWRSATDALDSIRDRFGTSAVAPAATVGPAGIRVKRAGDTQWGPNSG